MHSRPILRLGAAAVALGLLAALGACTGDDQSETPTTSTPGPTAKTVGGIAEEVLSYAPPEPVATGTGSLATGSGTTPATAEVTSLTSSAGSTVLTLRLTTPAEASPARGSLSHDGYGSTIDGITLGVGDERLYPGNFRYGVPILAKNCTCTELIRKLGPEGVWLSAQFGPLPPGTDTVDLTIPGFEPFAVAVAVKS